MKQARGQSRDPSPHISHPHCHPGQTADLLCPDSLICVTRTRRIPNCLAHCPFTNQIEERNHTAYFFNIINGW